MLRVGSGNSSQRRRQQQQHQLQHQQQLYNIGSIKFRAGSDIVCVLKRQRAIQRWLPNETKQRREVWRGAARHRGSLRRHGTAHRRPIRRDESSRGAAWMRRAAAMASTSKANGSLCNRRRRTHSSLKRSPLTRRAACKRPRKHRSF